MSKISSNPINTFSIGFREKEYDESERAELVAKHIKSSQSRVVKMEQGDPSVSIDLLIHSLFSLGTTRKELARAIEASPIS